MGLLWAGAERMHIRGGGALNGAASTSIHGGSREPISPEAAIRLALALNAIAACAALESVVFSHGRS